MSHRIINVHDRRHAWIGSWIIEDQPLDVNALVDSDIGRTVIWQSYGKAEAGTISSWRFGLVFVRFSTGDTGAACKPDELSFAVKPCDGNLDR